MRWWDLTRKRARDAFRKGRERVTLDLVSLWQEEVIFSRREPEPAIKSPQDYAGAFPDRFPRLKEFKQEEVYAPDGARIGLWVKEPDSPDKPVYVLFHGRNGNWAHMGLRSEINAFEKRYREATGTAPPVAEAGIARCHSRDYVTFDLHHRLHWLEAAAETGAGVIAVHSRGHGLSRGADGRVGEMPAKDDAVALADYLEWHGIPGRHVVTAGESMGGARAAILAEEMTRRGDPPAVLGLVASFASMAEVAAYQLAGRGYFYLPPEGSLNYAQELARLEKKIRTQLRHPLDTAKRLRQLDPARTALYVANHPDDAAFPFGQNNKLATAGRTHGMKVLPRELTGEYQLPQYTDHHTNWDPAMVMEDLEGLYRMHSLFCSPMHTDRNGVPGHNGSVAKQWSRGITGATACASTRPVR